MRHPMRLTRVTGCPQCSRRRIDCDGAKPACKKCTSRGLTCSGFGINYRFRDGLNPRFKGQRVPDVSDERATPHQYTHEHEVISLTSPYDPSMMTFDHHHTNTYPSQSASPSSSDGMINDTGPFESVLNFSDIDIASVPVPNWDILDPPGTIDFYVPQEPQIFDPQPLNLPSVFDLDFSHCWNQFPDLM